MATWTRQLQSLEAHRSGWDDLVARLPTAAALSAPDESLRWPAAAPGRLSLAVAAGFIARCDLAVGGKRSKFRLHFRGAPLDARLRRVPRIPVVAAGWRNECERLRNPPSTYARGNFRRHIPRE